MAGVLVEFVGGEVWWAFADGQDDGAVGCECVGASAVVASDLVFLAVFESVVGSAEDGGVVLVGVAALVPFGVVVDV